MLLHTLLILYKALVLSVIDYGFGFHTLYLLHSFIDLKSYRIRI